MKQPTKLKNKGFTLIELLVVVAIIGVLATVVLASLSSARGKAKDAAIKQSLTQFQKQAELQYLDTGNYNTICDAGTISGNIFADAYGRTKKRIDNLANMCVDQNGTVFGSTPNPLIISLEGSGLDSNGSMWTATISLSTGAWFCIDSLGNTTVNMSRTISPWNGSLDKTCN